MEVGVPSAHTPPATPPASSDFAIESQPRLRFGIGCSCCCGAGPGAPPPFGPCTGRYLPSGTGVGWRTRGRTTDRRASPRSAVLSSAWTGQAAGEAC